jgi:hypothetical protein
VREHVVVQGIERGIVDVRGEDAFFEIVEDDDAHGAAEPTKGPLVELGPDLRARLPHQQAHRLREEPSVSTKSRVRRYLPVCGWRTIGPSP